jgi:hypothetical protein
VARDQQVIHFRCAEPPTANPKKHQDELLDAYLFVEDTDALYAEYAAQGIEFTRGVANMPWHSREFVGEGLRWPSAGFRRQPVVFSGQPPSRLIAPRTASGLARTRISSVRFTQRIVPAVSTRNSAGRAMSLPFSPPFGCNTPY